MDVKTSDDEQVIRPRRFLDTPPFYYAKYYAKKHRCDLAVPNATGIGNIIVFTRLIEEYALRLGKRLRLLTGPINPWVGVVERESKYPLWQNNPFVSAIVDADEIDPQIMENVVLEQDNYCQFGHVMKNICHCYGLKPRKLRPSLFLSVEEMAWGLETLSALRRPVICLHPAGKSSSTPDSPWYIENWLRIIDTLKDKVSFVHLQKFNTDHKKLDVYSPNTTLREAMSIIWAADMFLGFDSGLSHMATAFEKPSLVLWDAVRKSKVESAKHPGFSSATMLRWSYPQNKNVLILEEKDDEVVGLCRDCVLEVTLNGRDWTTS
jgi:hypothetical protein